MVGFNPEIFRAYDIRGVYGRDLDEDFAFELGVALVRYLNRTKFLLAHDDREFSDGLAEAVARGIASAGGDVSNLGLATTPFYNYVFHHELGADGGMIVTASHNPSNYGGFKLFAEGGRIIDIESGLGAIKELIGHGGVGRGQALSKYGGKVARLDRADLLKKYINFVIKKSKVNVGEVSQIKIKINYPKLAVPEIELLADRLGLGLRDHDFDIMFTLDGDADRLIVSDASSLPSLVEAKLGRDEAKPLGADLIAGLLVQQVRSRFHKPSVVYDLRFSRGVLEKFRQWGIESYRSRVGRSFVKEDAIKYHADLGGELSGHIVFKEFNYNELPYLAMLKLLHIIASTGQTINQLVKPFKTWFNSGEINLPIGGQRSVADIFGRLKYKYKDGRLDRLDGLTIDYHDWWFNIRVSNTEPLLRLLVEAKSQQLLDQRANEIIEITKAVRSQSS